MTHPLGVALNYLVGERTRTSDTLAEIKDPQGFSKTIFEGISAENKHVENRFQWNLGLQGFLFASYAIAVAQKDNTNLAKGFADIVAKVGVASCIITLIGIYAAYTALNQYKIKWLSNRDKLQAVAAEPFSSPWPSLVGRLPSTGITASILVAWFYLDKLI